MKVFLFSFFFLYVTSLVAQDVNALTYPEIDSVLNLYNRNRGYNQAIKLALETSDKAKLEAGVEDSLCAEYLEWAAYLYQQKRDFKQAIVTFEKSNTIFAKLFGEKSIRYATGLDYLAQLYHAMGNYPKAEELFKKAIAIENKAIGAPHVECANTLNNLARMYQEMGKFEVAEFAFLQSLEIKKKVLGENDKLYASGLNNLAQFYKTVGKLEESESTYLQALKIWRRLGEESNSSYATTLNNIAALYKALGQYEQAVSFHLQSIEIKKKLYGDAHPRYAVSLNNLATIYQVMNKLEAADSMYSQAIEIWKNQYGEYHSSLASLLNNLAVVYKKMKRNKEAEELYKQTLAIMRKGLGESHPSYALALSNLASLSFTMGKNKVAQSLGLQAVSIMQVAYGIKHPEYARLLANLANMYLGFNTLDTAYAYSMASIAANSIQFESVFSNLFTFYDSTAISAEQIPHYCCPEVEPIEFLKLAELETPSFIDMNSALQVLLKITKAQYKELFDNNDNVAGKKKLLEHYNISKGSMKINERIRSDFSRRDNKLRALKMSGFIAECGVDAAFELGNREDLDSKEKAIYYNTAFDFAEENKSMLLIDAVKGNRARTLGDLPDSLVMQEIKLQQAKETIKKEKSAAKTNEERAEIIEKENELNEEIEEFLNSIKNKYPKYHHFKYQNIIAKATEIQSLLATNDLLLEYFVTDSLIYLFAISNKEVKLYSLAVNKSTLSEQVKSLRFALSDYKFIVKREKEAYQRYTQSAYWFYERLLKVALEEETAMDNLIIIADGELGHLPFEVFLTQRPSQSQQPYLNLSYLLNDYNISYDYSATLWKENRNYNKHSNNHKILACASSYPSQDYWRSQNNISQLKEQREPSVYELRKALSPLPYTQNEVVGLSEFFEGDFLLGDSTNERFFKENAQNYGVIHLAMHGLLHPRLSMLSSLAFTENNDTLEDNFLQAYEISRLHLNADLVVLSACETGYGKFEQGEGIISLARSFMYAGTPSLVVSLWSVNDYSTGVIMTSFYKKLSEGLAKDVALRQAKLDYLKTASGITGHPAFWSPFIQLGDNRPLQLAKRGEGMLLWLIGGGLLLMIMGVVLLKKRK